MSRSTVTIGPGGDDGRTRDDSEFKALKNAVGSLGIDTQVVGVDDETRHKGIVQGGEELEI